jgi:hypothetical protein
VIDSTTLKVFIKKLRKEDLEFIVMYMIGGLMQTVEYYLFDEENKISISEFAEKITIVEERIRGI